MGIFTTFQGVCISPYSTPPRVDRGGKTPDPALGGVCEFLRPQHSHYWAGSIWACGRLLWLQWPWPGGEGGVIIGQLVFFLKKTKKLVIGLLNKCFYWFAVLLFFPSEIQAGAKLSLNRQFMDERWSKHRVVTCLDWSPQVTFVFCFKIAPTHFSEHRSDMVWNDQNVNVKIDLMYAKALLINCWNNLALHSYNALWLHSLSLTAFTFSHKSRRKSKLCPTQIVTYSEAVMICFLWCLRSFHAWFDNDFWQWLNTSSLFTGFTCPERNPYPCDLRLCIHKL